jgi:phosphatidylserine/phosphatidylglycerophosphate/cardiolipin synthase-like enzyme
VHVRAVDRRDAGVEVKIIIGEYQTPGHLDHAAGFGVNVVDNVKIQNNVHNNGIVVDGQAVLVGSRNWSTDGTLYQGC